MPIEQTSVSKPVVRDVETNASSNLWSMAQGSLTGGKDSPFSSIWDKTVQGTQKLLGLDKAAKEQEEQDEDSSERQKGYTNVDLSSTSGTVSSYSSRFLNGIGNLFTPDRSFGVGAATNLEREESLDTSFSDAGDDFVASNDRYSSSANEKNSIREKEQVASEDEDTDSKDEEDSTVKARRDAATSLRADGPRATLGATLVAAEGTQSSVSAEPGTAESIDSAEEPVAQSTVRNVMQGSELARKPEVTDRNAPVAKDTAEPVARGTSVVTVQNVDLGTGSPTSGQATPSEPAVVSREKRPADANVSSPADASVSELAPEGSAQGSKQLLTDASKVAPVPGTRESALFESNATLPSVEPVKGEQVLANVELKSASVKHLTGLAGNVEVRSSTDSTEVEAVTLAGEKAKAVPEAESAKESVASLANRPVNPQRNVAAAPASQNVGMPSSVQSSESGANAERPGELSSNSLSLTDSKDSQIGVQEGDKKDSNAAVAQRTAQGREARTAVAESAKSHAAASSSENANGAKEATVADVQSLQSQVSRADFVRSQAGAQQAGRVSSNQSTSNASTTTQSVSGATGVGGATSTMASTGQANSGSSGEQNAGQELGQKANAATMSKGVEKGSSQDATAFDVKTASTEAGRKSQAASKAQTTSYVSKTADEVKEVISNIAKSIDRLVSNKLGTMNMKLNFEQGGSVNIRISMENGQVSTVMQTDVAGLEGAIKANWGDLASDWNQKGVKLNTPQFQPGAAPSGDDSNSDSWSSAGQGQRQGRQAAGGDWSNQSGNGRSSRGSTPTSSADAGVTRSNLAGESSLPDVGRGIEKIVSDRELKTYA